MSTRHRYDKIEKQIKKILEKMLNDPAMPKWSKPEWTRQIKNRICKLGRENRFYICASETDVKPDCEEWLYDVTWLKLDRNKSIRYSPLVLECEWAESYDEIYNDFTKLLLARSQHRIMIFQNTTKKNDVKDIIKKLKKEARNFKDSQKGDRYFFAGYDNNTDSFKFDLLVL